MDPRSAYVTAVRRIRSLLQDLGALAALERSDRWLPRHLRTLFAIYDAEDLASLDLPWWTYGAIEHVERFIEQHGQPRVFEFGSGASTVWLARRGARIHSVEHDETFAEAVRRLVPTGGDVELHVVPPAAVSGIPAVRSHRRGFEHLDFSDYVGTIDRVGGPFDLVIIDGRARLDSLRRALPHVSEEGLLLFDDVGRRRYRPALDVAGFTTQVIRGATPCVLYRTSTALLRRETA